MKPSSSTRSRVGADGAAVGADLGLGEDDADVHRSCLAGLSDGVGRPAGLPHDVFSRGADPESGAFGVAVQSHYFSTGAVVPWVEAGVGGVATQSFADISLRHARPRAHAPGESADAALAALVAAEPGQAMRQVGMVDRAGLAAAHTGAGCVAHAGHRTGPGWTVQANMMLGPTVPDAMADAYTGTQGDFLDRLLAALDAAQAAGGDIRGQQAAALLVSSTAPDARGEAGTPLRLQVEDHERPLEELRRLVTLHRAYSELSDAQTLAQAGDFDAVMPAIEPRARAGSRQHRDPLLARGDAHDVRRSAGPPRARRVLRGASRLARVRPPPRRRRDRPRLPRHPMPSPPTPIEAFEMRL